MPVFLFLDMHGQYKKSANPTRLVQLGFANSQRTLGVEPSLVQRLVFSVIHGPYKYKVNN